jgi:hypothetical protein
VQTTCLQVKGCIDLLVQPHLALRRRNLRRQAMMMRAYQTLDQSLQTGVAVLRVRERNPNVGMTHGVKNSKHRASLRYKENSACVKK